MAKEKKGTSSNEIVAAVYATREDLPNSIFEKEALMRRKCNRFVENDRAKTPRRSDALFEIDVDRGFNFENNISS